LFGIYTKNHHCDKYIFIMQVDKIAILNEYDLLQFDTVPENIINAFFDESLNYKNRFLLSVFAYNNGISCDSLLSILHGVNGKSLIKNRIKEIKSIFETLKSRTKDNEYYSYSIYDGKYTYLSGLCKYRLAATDNCYENRSKLY